MDIGSSYYVVRSESEGYVPVLGDKDSDRLVVFTDNNEAIERAKREGEGAVVEHRSPREVNALALDLGCNYILVLNKDGSRTMVDVERQDS